MSRGDLGTVEGVSEQPHDDDAERSLFGAVRLAAPNYYEAAAHVGPGDFFRKNHEVVWRALGEYLPTLSADEARDALDVVAFADHLWRLWGHSSETAQAVESAVRLIQSAPGILSFQVEREALIVKRLSQLRGLGHVALELAGRAYQRGEDPTDLITGAVSQMLAQLDAGTATRTTAPDAVSSWYERHLEAIHGDSGGGTSTGIPALDRLCGGIHGGRSYYIGGLTKMGKTTLAMAIAAHLGIREGWAVDVWSVEQSAQDLTGILVGHLAAVDLQAYEARARRSPDHPEVSEAGERIQRAANAVAAADYQFEAQGLPNVHEIALLTRARHARLAGKKPLALIVDYVQNCHTGQPRQGDSERIAECSRVLNGISKDLQIPVFILFQFNKEGEKHWHDKREAPRFSDARGSSQIGNDANHLWIVHRNWRDFEDDPRNAEYCQVFQPLSRHGRLGGSITLRACLPLARFSAHSGEEPPAAEQWRAKNSKGGGGFNGGGMW